MASVSLVDELLPTYYNPVPGSHEIKTTTYCEDTRRLTLEWTNGDCSEFPSIWLRDNCTCSDCFSKSSQFRILLFSESIKLDSTIVSVENKAESVSVEFAHGHVSTFTSAWLWHRRFCEDMREERWKSLLPLTHEPWSGAVNPINKATYKEVTETDEGFVKFSESLMMNGCFIVTDSPLERCAQDWVNKTNILITKSFYGEIFEVNTRGDPTNLAYTHRALDLHNDQNYLLFNLKVQYLHFRKQSSRGGENTMVDGLYAARKLRDEHPAHYKILTETLIDNNDALYKVQHEENPEHVEHPHLLYARKPLIVLDPVTGEPDYIQFNNFPRSSFFTEPIEKVERWYTAMEVWLDILKSCQIKFKCQPGDILIFDNHRVLHGRLEFDSSEPRSVEGWYSEWDWIHSRWRIARREQLRNSHKSDQ